MDEIKNLNAAYINAWCEEWEIEEEYRLRALEMHAEDELVEVILDFLAICALERRRQQIREGESISLCAFLNDPLHWARKAEPKENAKPQG